MNCIKLLDFRDMLNFNFLGKGIGPVSASHFANDFSGKMIFILHSMK